MHRSVRILQDPNETGSYVVERAMFSLPNPSQRLESQSCPCKGSSPARMLTISGGIRKATALTPPR